MNPAATDPTADAEALAIARAAFDHARHGETAALAALLDLGLPPDVLNDKGDSLLMLASYHGHLETSGLLLECGADPALRNDRGQTPLAGTAFKGDAAMVTLLLDHGASLERRDAAGVTAHRLAQSMGALRALARLVGRGDGTEEPAI